MSLNPDGLALSERYAETMNGEILPFLDARRRDVSLEGEPGKPLFVSRFDADAPRGTVLIVHGFTENAVKFSELIHSLLKHQWSVVAYDQRGHGRSWRADDVHDLSLTHIDDFGEYVRDMQAVCAAVLDAMPRPHHVFCHSMGGAVTALYLEAHPDTFDRAAMCAPMIAPQLNGFPKPVALGLCCLEGMLGRRKRRILGTKPYAWPDDFGTAVCSSKERFDWYEGVRRDNPRFSNNAPTYGWTREAIHVTDAILAPGAVERIRARVRLYTAEMDDSVLPGPQKRFIDRVPEGVQVFVRGTRHEIYRATDEVLFPWWRDVLDFLLTQAAKDN